MLFEPDRHELLRPLRWDASLVRAAIGAIVRDVEQSRLPQGHWPVHPLDADIDAPSTGLQSMYLGSAGVIWALWYLQRAGAAELHTDVIDAIEQAAQNYQKHPDTGELVPSYFLGEVGIELVRWRLTGSTEAAHRLYVSITQNIPNPTNEALWAAPGTMIAAWHLWKATGEDRWRTLFSDNVAQLWRTWQPVSEGDASARDFCLWTQDLYGHRVQLLGAGHGFAGNVFPLLMGAALMDAQQQETLFARCATALQKTGIFEDGQANWPQSIGTPRPGRTHRLMQWCHGSPGIITSIAGHYPHERSDGMHEMLLAAGEAVWAAGPLAKGYGLCHGTSGNGYAFLKLFRRTGDSLWLDRARALAMHALTQYDQMRQTYGQGRYNLWTGDLGLAVFAWHCIEGTDGLPLLDIVD